MNNAIELAYEELKSSQELIRFIQLQLKNKRSELLRLVSAEFKEEQDYLESKIMQAYPDAKLKPIKFGFTVKSKHLGRYVSNIKKLIDTTANDRICNVETIDWYADARIKEVRITLTKTYMRSANKNLASIINSISIV